MKKTSIGGQALIEGLMMIGPQDAAIAVRKPDGEIVVDKRPAIAKGALNKIPVVRGAVGFFQQMVLGVKALMYSAEFVDIEGDDTSGEPSRFEKFIEKVFGDKFKDVLIYCTVLVSIAFSVGLFILLPNLLAGFMHFDKKTTVGVILYNLFEGLIRITLFVTYIGLTSLLKDMQRVWQYHGAEHKTIHCYENEEELTVENVRKFTTRHPRCGTSFLFLVMIISILMFSFLGWHDWWMNILLRVVLIPVVAGVSLEFLKLVGRSESTIAKVLNAPGMAFQAFTTREPDDSQIEVAIAAFKGVTIKDRDADKW